MRRYKTSTKTSFLMHVEEIIELIYISWLTHCSDHFTINPKYVTFQKALFRDGCFLLKHFLFTFLQIITFTCNVLVSPVQNFRRPVGKDDFLNQMVNTQISQYLKKNTRIIFWRNFSNLPSNKTNRQFLKTIYIIQDITESRYHSYVRITLPKTIVSLLTKVQRINKPFSQYINTLNLLKEILYLQ